MGFTIFAWSTTHAMTTATASTATEQQHYWQWWLLSNCSRRHFRRNFAARHSQLQLANNIGHGRYNRRSCHDYYDFVTSSHLNVFKTHTQFTTPFLTTLKENDITDISSQRTRISEPFVRNSTWFWIYWTVLRAGPFISASSASSAFPRCFPSGSITISSENFI